MPPYIEDTGEVNWLVSEAMHREVTDPGIAKERREGRGDRFRQPREMIDEETGRNASPLL